MSYEPTVWKTGDIVSSEKLNKLEEGVAGAGSGSGPNVVRVNISFDETDIAADLTVSQIIEACKSQNTVVIGKFGTQSAFVCDWLEDPDDGNRVDFICQMFEGLDKLKITKLRFNDDGTTERLLYNVTLTPNS